MRGSQTASCTNSPNRLVPNHRAHTCLLEPLELHALQWLDRDCNNDSCGHDGADGNNYICCKPTDDYPSGAYCHPYWIASQAWCLMNVGDPCKHNCQCPTGVSCNDGICKH